MSQADNKALMLKRDMEAKQALADLAENHMLQVQMREAAKAEEVAEVVKSVPKEVLRDWRFQVAIKMIDSPAVMGNERQIHYDDALVALARYAVTGKV